MDDHELVRDGLATVLAGIYGGVRLVQAGSVAEACEVIRACDSFDLAILDMLLPDGNGIELMDELGQHHPEVPMIVVSGDPKYKELALSKGALGFLTKTSDSTDLLDAIGAVLVGQVYEPRVLNSRVSLGNSLLRQAKPPPANDDNDQNLALTPRQKAVLGLVMQGKSNRDISLELGLAESTVKVYVSGLLKALNVSSRTQVVLAATGLQEA